MDPKPSRIPRKASVEVHNPSSTSSGAKMMYEGRSSVLDDIYATRESEKQEAEFRPTLYDETDMPSGAPSGFLTPSEDSDSKRPKLGSACSSSNNANCFSNCSDSIWESRFPRTPVPFNSTSRTEATLCKETEIERTEPSHREGFGRVLSSYAQGARPRETLFGSLRRTTSSLSRVLSSSGSPSAFSRNSSRSFSNSSPTGVEVIQRSAQGGFMHRADTSERRNVSLLQARPLNDFASESSGSRCRPRQLLSRLASSMSSTFSGSRISNRGHSSTRSLERVHSFQQSGDVSFGERSENLAQAGTSGRAVANFSQCQSPESSRGFGFLRWRRPGPQSQNFSLGNEILSSRPDDSENRNTGSWLSSLQSRSTLSRREGRDEAATSCGIINEAREDQLPILQRAVGTLQNSSREQSDIVQGVTPPPSCALPSTVTGSSSTHNTAAATLQTRSTSEFREVFSNSFIRLSMPYGPEHDYSDDVLIAIEFVNPSRSSFEQEKLKTASASSKDPEKLRKIQESLLLEDSDDEGSDICRICQMGAESTSTNPLIKPCNCTGSLQYVHQECIKKWLQSKINSGADLTAVITCELCKEKLQLDLEDFDVHELYRTREQARHDINSGLYLVLLLHLCEQRFSDIMDGTSETRTRLQFIHLARTLQQHIQDLETTDEDSEDEQDRFENRTPRGST